MVKELFDFAGWERLPERDVVKNDKVLLEAWINPLGRVLELPVGVPALKMGELPARTQDRFENVFLSIYEDAFR